MSNFMKSARSWLGLGNDPYYEDEYGDPDYDDEDEDDGYARRAEEPRPATPDPQRPPPRSFVVRRAPVREASGTEDDGGVRVISSSAPTPGSEPESRGVVRPLPVRGQAPCGLADDLQRRPAGGRLVQAVPAGDRQPPGCRPRPVPAAHRFRQRALLRPRGQHGAGGGQVFLLTPSGAQISDDERRRAPRAGSVGAETERGGSTSWRIICGLLTAFLVLIFARIILSWFPPGGQHVRVDPADSCSTATEWLMGPLRRVLPPVRLGAVALDLSPLVVVLGVSVLQSILC